MPGVIRLKSLLLIDGLPTMKGGKGCIEKGHPVGRCARTKGAVRDKYTMHTSPTCRNDMPLVVETLRCRGGRGRTDDTDVPHIHDDTGKLKAVDGEPPLALMHRDGMATCFLDGHRNPWLAS